MATFDCGFTLPYRGWLEITGTEGTVWVPDMWVPPRRATFEIRREGGHATEEVVVEVNCPTAQYTTAACGCGSSAAIPIGCIVGVLLLALGRVRRRPS